MVHNYQIGPHWVPRNIVKILSHYHMPFEDEASKYGSVTWITFVKPLAGRVVTKEIETNGPWTVGGLCVFMVQC